MNRIDKRLNELRKEGKKAFVAYITCGYPNIKTTESLMIELSRVGVDIIEMGMPFSDPMADGTTIQMASLAALKQKITLIKVFALAKRLRKKTEVPLVLFTYYNPIYHFGIQKVAGKMLDSGIDGLIVPDLLPEEAGELKSQLKKYNLNLIYLLAPTTGTFRMKKITRQSDGFIYYISRTGITGVRKDMSSDIKYNMNRIKRVTKKPVMIGFGISNPVQAVQVARISDGVVVGSAIINQIEKNLKKPGLIKNVGGFVHKLVTAVKQAK
ncbi:MAG: tryptophan synthase subunit alpha [Candidatus Omnitrophota bacterium]|nr:tryptophan synthase subunit alpha [Candidatus Omnitrophota bacterium]